MIVHFNHIAQAKAPRGGQRSQPSLGELTSLVTGSLMNLVEDGVLDTRVAPSLRIHLDWIQYRTNFRDPVCPQTCPKQMRNGPWGGTSLGRCEVIDHPCIWVKVFERSEATNKIGDLKTFIPAPDRTLQGTASWMNFYLARDSRPGRAGADPEPAHAPPPAREKSHTAA